MVSAAPAVSVAIRAWRRDSVGTAIASVLRHPRPDLELVVFDDAGMDDIVAACGDERVRLVRAPPGLDAAGRFLGALSACRGDCIALLDDDDAYLPGALERLHVALRADAAAGCASGRQWTKSGGAMAEGEHRLDCLDLCRRMLQGRWGTPTSTLLFRRVALEDVLAAAPLSSGVSPDFHLVFHLAMRGWAHVRLAAPVCRRAIGAGTISDSSTGARYALATLQRLSLEDGALEPLRRRAVVRQRLTLAFLLGFEGHRGEARAQLAQVRRDAPAEYVGTRLLAWCAAWAPRAVGRLLHRLRRWRAARRARGVPPPDPVAAADQRSRSTA